MVLLAVLVIGSSWLLPSAERATGSAWSLLPPVFAITLALVFRDVLVSLFLGVWLGTTLVAGADPARGLLTFVDTHVRGGLADPDHISIIVFSMLLGGMVGVMSRAAGTLGVVRLIEPLATTARRAQGATWFMGLSIFFDDYSNTLLVGSAMRPVSDRHRISREKLAYLVDSTAAPVACVALVSTWVGYQVSLLGDALQHAGSDLNPFSVFLASLPYAFYPFFALFIAATVAFTGRDWGPMLQAERRARQGELLSPAAQPLADFESASLKPLPDAPPRWLNAALPVLTVVVVTLGGLWHTGVQALAAKGQETGRLSLVIGASDPFTTLLWASLLGLLMAMTLAVGQGILRLRQAVESAVAGFGSMLLAMLVLTLAWALGSVCKELQTADFLVSAVGPHLPGTALPAAVFLVASAVSFATGTSWGTMAILTPLAIPLVLQSAPEHPHLVAQTVAAILGGSVFGDHCSPISDTTIMSSMATGCDHVDHVRTQLPYALLGGAVALLLGYLPEALLDPPPLVHLAAGALVIGLWFRFVAKPVS